jgi:hypothetical protein
MCSQLKEAGYISAVSKEAVAAEQERRQRARSARLEADRKMLRELCNRVKSEGAQSLSQAERLAMCAAIEALTPYACRPHLDKPDMPSQVCQSMDRWMQSPDTAPAHALDLARSTPHARASTARPSNGRAPASLLSGRAVGRIFT